MTDRETDHSALGAASAVGEQIVHPQDYSGVLSALFRDLEDKLVEHIGQRLEQQHHAQLNATHAGQTKMLAAYQSDFSGSTTEIKTALEENTRIVRVAVERFKDTNNAVAAIVLRLEEDKNRLDVHDKNLGFQDKRLLAVEKLRGEFFAFRKEVTERLDKLEEAEEPHVDNSNTR